MDETLKRIKRAVLAWNYRVTLKAELEMYADELSESDIRESILLATRIHKTIRSNVPGDSRRREYLHIIIGETLSGISIYTKGKLIKQRGVDVYYVFVSANRRPEAQFNYAQDYRVPNLWKQANQTRR